MSAVLEDVKSIDLTEWGTLNTAASPTKLAKGQSPNMQNVWTDEKPGSIITANGLIKVGTSPSGNPTTFCINYFKTSAGTQTFVLSDGATVWTTVDFQNFTSIITGLASTFQLRGLVIRDKLWLTNGSDAVRTFDGTSVVVLDGSGATPNVPKGRFIAYHDERVWLYHIPSNRSQLAFSALTDSSAVIINPDNASAWPSTNTIQISEGDADFGTALRLYSGYLFCFKQYTIWKLVGYDEYTYSKVKTRASTGSRFNESLGELDNLIHLIGTDGIYVFDGDTTERISDLIDSSGTSQVSFGFDQLQQPNTNNLFFEVADSADWNAGTVPANASIADSLIMAPADGSQADFVAGTTKTNIDTTAVPGSIQLSLITTGGSGPLISTGKTGFHDQSGGAGFIGNDVYITDGNNANPVGFGTSNDTDVSMVLGVSLDPNTIGKVILRNLQVANDGISGHSPSITNVLIQIDSNGSNNWVTVGSASVPSAVGGPTDYTITFNSVLAYKARVLINAHRLFITVTEVEVYAAGFQPTGQFISRALDYTVAPDSYGFFYADNALNSGTLTFYTQSSTDGVTWDAAVPVSVEGAIGSTIKRYLRWRADFTYGGLGTSSPIINAVYVGLQYFSAIHDTGGSIFAWGAFESDYSQAGQSILFYYRGATTMVGVSSASWNLIVPGGVISMATANRYVQFKVVMPDNITNIIPVGGPVVNFPTVNSVTINWVSGSGTQPSTLQNVASTVWKNRYWLSAASSGATANDTILVRGKKTFGSPWMLKNFQLLSFTRFQDSLYAGSSVDGSIYKVDSGYSINGAAMDSFFETGDFTFGGFYVDIAEVLIEVERTGQYFLGVGISIDRGATYTEKLVDLSTSTFAPSYTKKLNFTAKSDRIRLRFRTNAADQPFQVHNCYVIYKQGKERGSIK